MIALALLLAQAQGPAIELREQSVQISIRERLAVKTVRSVFRNNTDRVQEDDFLMHIEPDVSVESFKVTIDGKEQSGELLDAEKARRIYESIVRQNRDPALLEYYGYQLLRVRAFPIQPRAEYKVEVTLREALRVAGGVARVVTLNHLSKGEIASFSCAADVESARPIRMVFSPTHDINVQRAGDRKLRVSYEKKNYAPMGPLVFYYALADDEIGATLLAYREPGEDGTFMLTLSPRWEIRDSERVPRDVVFAVDVSGSMRHDRKIDQVREALARCVRSLHAGDRFNIVAYSTETQTWKERLIDAAEEAKEAAEKFAARLEPRSGTAIEEALKVSLGQFDSREAVKIVVFLTDGLPTIGQTDTARLIEGAKKLNAVGARIFAFGVGYDVNTQLLDALAVGHGGDREYVRPNEDAAFALAAFAARIDTPVLASPKVEFEGIEATQIYPRTLPDVFRGGQLLVLGRFKGEGQAKLTLTGKFLGRDRRSEHEIDFAAAATHDFIPKLWAIKKIDFLLDQIRLNGQQKELIEEVVRLAKKHAIVTPYTSYLITEDVPTPEAGAMSKKTMDESLEKKFVGKEEFDKARNQAEWRKAENKELQDRAGRDALGYSSAGAERELAARMRQVCDVNFFNRGGVWIDSRIETGKKYEEIEVEFGSDAYWELVRNEPELARRLALGKQVRCLDSKGRVINCR
jgi:Ca-activated chloride channel family protein